MSFARYAVIGQSPKMPDEALLAKLAEHALRETEVGVPADVEYGWVGPRHILDGEFSFEQCVFNDAVHFGLRIDTNRVPSEIKNAYIAIEEAAQAKQNPSGFISKQQKRMVKDVVGRKIDDELRSGKFRRSKFSAMLWDVPNGIVYGPAGSSVREKLQEIFQRTFGLELQVLTSGHVAERLCEKWGKHRDYEDWTPTRFARSAHDPDKPADYPWCAKGDGAKDFLGNEFLIWLWHQAFVNEGIVKHKEINMTIMFDRSLDLDCVFAETGKTGLRGTGPTRMPEALDALRSGKVPRKAGLIVESNGSQFNLSLGGDTLNVGSLKLPDIEDADTARTLFEERITLLRDFGQTLNELFEGFLSQRLKGWEGHVTTIRKWVAASQRQGAVSATVTEAAHRTVHREVEAETETVEQ